MRPGGTRRRGVWALVVGAAAVLLVVVASAAGSVKPFDKKQSTWSLKPGAARSPELYERPVGAELGWWNYLWTGLLWLSFVLVVLFVVRAVFVLISLREPKKRISPSPGAAERLAEAVDRGLVEVERGTPRDAVIACWVAVEDAAAVAGVARRPAETSAEFIVRVLAVDGVSAPDLATLGDLYREARYSTHPSTEETRAAARRALSRLQEDLSVVRASGWSFWRR